MKELHANHLIIGGGLLGLVVADQLLRREATGVIIIERDSEPLRAMPGVRDLVLSTGIPEYRELEERGVLLLEEWESYLGLDPDYRCSGSVEVPVLLEPENAVMLDAADAMAKAPGLSIDDMDQAIFHGLDGSVSATDIRLRLASRIREHKGTYASSQEVFSLEHDGDRFRFTLAVREGTADRVYVTAGAGTPALLASCGVECPWSTSAFHTFQLDYPSDAHSVVRIQEAQLAVVQLGERNELSAVVCDPGPSESIEPRVNWKLLEELRKQEQERYPALTEARIRRAYAELHLELDARAPGIISAHDGKLLAGGAYGLHRLPLALGVGEKMAQLGLQ